MTPFVLAAVLVLLDPGIAGAEVSDKIPSIPFIWAQGFGGAVAIILLSRIRNWAGFILLPVTIALLDGTREMLGDPFLGPAILQEQGRWYGRSAYGSACMMIAAHFLGWRLGNRGRSAAVPGDAA